MAKKTKYNPERRNWKGKSYKKGGKRIREEADKSFNKDENVVKTNGYDLI